MSTTTEISGIPGVCDKCHHTVFWTITLSLSRYECGHCGHKVERARKEWYAQRSAATIESDLDSLYRSDPSVRALCDQYSRDYGTLGVSHGMIARVCDQLGIPK